MARVEVINVFESLVHLKVDTPKPDCDTLALCKGCFLTWKKEMITFASIGIVHIFRYCYI
jgi:hypothetical protein